MKYVCLFICLVSSLSVHLWGEERFPVTLSKLGFPQPIVARGREPCICLPLLQGETLPLVLTQLQVHLRSSLDFQEEGKVTISADGLPLKEVWIRDLSQPITFSFSEEDVPPSTLQITARAPNERTGEDSWIALDPSSLLTFSTIQLRDALSQFFLNGERTFQLQMNSSSREHVEAALQLSAAVGSCAVPWGLQLDFHSTSKKQIVLENRGEGIRIDQETLTLSLESLSQVLNYLQALSMTPGVKEHLFSQSISFSGKNRIVIPLSIFTHPLGVSSKSIDLNVQATHQALAKGEKAYLSLSKNGLPLDTYSLATNGGKGVYSFSLESSELSDPSLVFLECSSSGDLSIKFEKESYWERSEELGEERVDFRHFLAHSTVHLSIALPSLGSKDLFPIFQMVEKLAQWGGARGRVQGVLESENIPDETTAFLEFNSSSKLRGHQVPLAIQEGTSLIDPGRGTTLLSSSKDAPLVLLQVDQIENEVPVLAVHEVPSNSVQWIAEMSERRLRDQRGDFLIWQEGSWFSFKQSDHLEVGGSFPFAGAFRLWKKVLLIGGGLLIIGFMVYVWRRLTPASGMDKRG